jgi:hypothetical protein
MPLIFRDVNKPTYSYLRYDESGRFGVMIMKRHKLHQIAGIKHIQWRDLNIYKDVSPASEKKELLHVSRKWGLLTAYVNKKPPHREKRNLPASGKQQLLQVPIC